MRTALPTYLCGLMLLILVACNGGEGVDTSQSAKNYPQDDAWPHFAELVMPLPPSPCWKSGIAWIVALQDENSSEAGEINVQSLRLFCKVNGVDTMVAGDNDSAGSGVSGGGLYIRHPWFDGDTNEPIPGGVDTSRDTITIQVSTRPDRVWHYWGKKVNIPDGTTACWSQVKFRATKSAWFQLGLDFWKDLEVSPCWCSKTTIGTDSCINTVSPDRGCVCANTEGGASNWYFGYKDWTVVETPH